MLYPNVDDAGLFFMRVLIEYNMSRGNLQTQ